MAAVAAVAVGMVAADQLGIAHPERPPVGVEIEPEHAQMPAVGLAQLAPVLAGAPLRLEAGADRVERIVEIGPARARRAVGGEGAGLAVPAAIGILRGADLVGAHPLEIIVAGVELADMVEAEPAPVAGPVEVRAASGAGRAEFAGRVAAGLGARLRPPLDPPVEPRLPLARARQSLTPLSRPTVSI